MKIKEHTRNQKRMYRIHKQEEKIQELELLVGKLQQENDKLKEQQKKFIKYLEDEIQSCEAVSDLLFNSNKEMKVYEEILKKYKSIIGVSDETN